MCRLLGVSASGFHEWLGRPPSARSLANARLLVRIPEFFALSHRTYGSPRIWKDLAVAGERCGENRIARLKHDAGIRAQVKPRRLPVVSLVATKDPTIRLQHNKYIHNLPYAPGIEGTFSQDRV